MKRVALAAMYVAVVALLATAIHFERAGAHRSAAKDSHMSTWSEIGSIRVKAKPEGIWTWAYDLVNGPALVKIEATGEWSYSAGVTCGPNGDLNSLLNPQHAILPEAPVGALLVKIGGSTAGLRDGDVHVAGSAAVIPVDENTRAPIFLTINDEPAGLSDNDGELTVKLFIARLPTPEQTMP